MAKSDETRRKISETALASFQERGFEQTTLRLIASEAGVSVGNAYYYFPSKNHLVQELYSRVQDGHRERAIVALEGETDIAKRLRIALETGLDGLGPYHSTAPEFLSAAIGPTSAVSPFGEDAAGSRQAAIEVFQLVVDGSKNTVPAYLKERLPELLWLVYMGLALYWVYDQSPDQQKSRSLVRKGTALFGQLLPLTRLPLMRKPVTDLLDLFEEARS